MDATERVSGVIGTEADVDAGVYVVDLVNSQFVEVGAVLACDGRRIQPPTSVSRHHDVPLAVHTHHRHVVLVVVVDSLQPLRTQPMYLDYLTDSGHPPRRTELTGRDLAYSRCRNF